MVESHDRETSYIKSIFASEFGSVRKALDESVNEKTRLEIETSRLHEENANLKNQLEKKIDEVNVAQSFELKYNDLLAQYNEIFADQKKALDNNTDLEKEIVNLNSVLNDLRKHLEAETLARIEMENTAQSLREKLAFSSQMHSTQEVDAKNNAITINDGDTVEKLHQLRDQYENLMRANREEIGALYEAKIANFEAEAARANASAASAIEEMRSTGNQIALLNAEISELKGQATGYSSRIRDLESMLDYYIRERGESQAEIHRLHEEMAQQVQEFHDLMDIKMSLHLEIAAYRELLTSEEERWEKSNRGDYKRSQNFDQTPSIDHDTISRKRKRTSEDIETDDIHMPSYSIVCSAKGDLEIQESCPEGKFVRIYNKGDHEIAIGGWLLKRTAGGRMTVLKFRRTIAIEPKSTLTVWSSDAQAPNEPPANIVMKKNWVASE